MNSVDLIDRFYIYIKQYIIHFIHMLINFILRLNFK